MGHLLDFITNSADGVFAVDRTQAIVLWNARAATMLGHRAEDVLGKKCYRVLCGRDSRDQMVCRHQCRSIEAANRLAPAETIDLACRTRPGEEIWLNVSTVVAPSDRGDLSVLIHLFREVTREHDIMRATRELAELYLGDGQGEHLRLTKPEGHCTLQIELTRRERQILALLASGLSSNAIAEELCISVRTVGNHVNSILGKLDVHSRLEAVTYSIKNGLV